MQTANHTLGHLSQKTKSKLNTLCTKRPSSFTHNNNRLETTDVLQQTITETNWHINTHTEQLRRSKPLIHRAWRTLQGVTAAEEKVQLPVIKGRSLHGRIHITFSK